MKILILIITITWSFGGGYQSTPTVKIVSSPESAAIYVWEDRQSVVSVEPDQKKYELFEIDFKVKEIKSIPFPTIRFPKEGRDTVEGFNGNINNFIFRNSE